MIGRQGGNQDVGRCSASQPPLTSDDIHSTNVPSSVTRLQVHLLWPYSEMDEVPPSYLEAISRDPWTLIAPYVDSRDLHAACLVSRSWNQVFTKILWEEPDFGIEDGKARRKRSCL